MSPDCGQLPATRNPFWPLRHPRHWWRARRYLHCLRCYQNRTWTLPDETEHTP